VESVESQNQASHSFHKPLGNLAKGRRDSPISPAPACASWKSGKPKADFPLFHATQAMTMTVPVSKPKKKERKSAAARPPHSSNPAPSREPDFMLILRLENAGG
jgi:hypothetical protein